MPTHAEQRRLDFSPEQMFDLVSDIESYPEFLPWCVACRITSRDDNIIWGDLIVGFLTFRESFRSKVTLERPDLVHVEYIDGPFRYLNNHWRFLPQEDGAATIVDFYIDFEFRSRILQAVAAKFFNEAVLRMVNAFERRAHEIYGPDV
jgi:coenzyme Q-binding protein COQ10